jgi:hypothetical protein
MFQLTVQLWMMIPVEDCAVELVVFSIFKSRISFLKRK